MLILSFDMQWKLTSALGKPEECSGPFHFDYSISKQFYPNLVSATKVILDLLPLLFRGGWHSLLQARAFILALGINCLWSSNASIIGLSICENSEVNLSVLSLFKCVSEEHEIISRGGFELCFAQCHNAEWRSQPNILLPPKAAKQPFPFPSYQWADIAITVLKQRLHQTGMSTCRKKRWRRLLNLSDEVAWKDVLSNLQRLCACEIVEKKSHLLKHTYAIFYWLWKIKQLYRPLGKSGILVSAFSITSCIFESSDSVRGIRE